MALSTAAEVRRHIEATPLGDTPEAMRAGFAARLGPQPQGTPLELGGRPALAVGEGPTVLFLHGGGYVFGAPATHMHAMARLAASGLRVVAPAYRLAPEHVWPAPLEDARAALSALPGPVAVAGISSGGHLALRLALDMPERIAALALMAPNTDRSGLSGTRAPNAPRDAMNDDAGDAALARLAMPDLAPDDPAASPVLDDLSGLPPLHLSVGGEEVLLDDALLLARRAALAGVPVRLRLDPGLFHMYQLWPQSIPEAAAALDEAAAFLKAAL